LNVTRFVNAPVIRAGVMIANIIWYAIRTVVGMAEGAYTEVGVTPRRNACSKLP
jgi:hypothetical protein